MSPEGHRYRSERAKPEHADGLLALFESAGSGCFCNYWYFQGDKNAWLEQCYLRPEENRSALVARLTSSDLCGVVARAERDGSICGFMNVSRATSVARLYDQRVYRNLPCFRDEPARGDVFTIACCYVAEAERGRGVARVLLEGAISAARAVGAGALEAFPRGAPDGEKLRPDEVWQGPEALFLAAGFTQVSDFRAYPVLRLHLR